MKERFLHYRIVKELGQGGMSSVYLALDEHLHREVALKILHPFLASESDYRKRFQKEAQIIAQLKHPGIVQIYNYSGGLAENLELFLVTEYIKGSHLKDFVQAAPLIKYPELAASLVRELALILDYAHQKNIIHRDIKPENIMIDEEGNLKIVDFGIAQESAKESLTQAGAFTGSFLYVPPEIIEGKKPSPQADIFSLSTVWYGLSTGVSAFEAPSLGNMVQKILKVQVVPPHEINPELSKELSFLIQKGMALNPNDRFASALEMALAIDEALSKQGFYMSLEVLKGVLQKRSSFVLDYEAWFIDKSLQFLPNLMDQNKSAQAFYLLSRILSLDPHQKQAQKWLEKLSHASQSFHLRWGYLGLLGLLMLQDIPKKRVVIPPQTKPPTSFSEVTSLPVEVPPPKEVASELPKTQLVNLTIFPFANLYVDKKLVAQQVSSYQLNLGIGKHEIRLEHPYAQTLTQTLEIKHQKSPPNYHFALLKTKPARLSIKSNVGTAHVVLNGIYQGTALESLQNPIVVGLPNQTHRLEVELLLTHEGFEPQVLKHELRAGEKSQIEVLLKKK